MGLFGSLMHPTVPGAVPTPAAPAGGTGAPNLEQGWREYLSNPTVQAGLLQFGLNMMSPMQPGQSFGGHLAGGIAGAGGAMQRVEARNLALEDRQREFEQQQAEQDLRTREVGVREEGVKLTKEQIAQQRERDFNENVARDPAAIEARAEAEARGASRGASQGGVFQPLAPSDIQAYMAQGPAAIMSGKASDEIKARYVQAYLQATRPQMMRYTDPVSGQTSIVEQIGMPPTLIQKQAFKLAGGVEDVPGGGGGIPGASSALGVPVPSGRLPNQAGRTLGEMAAGGYLAGPVPALLNIARRDPTGMITDARGAAASTQAKTELDTATGDLVRALANDPRDALESQRIREDLNISTGWLDSGPALVDRLVALDNNLERRLNQARTVYNDISQSAEARKQAQTRIADITNFRAFALPQERVVDEASAAAFEKKLQAGQVPAGTAVLVADPNGGYRVAIVGGAPSPAPTPGSTAPVVPKSVAPQPGTSVPTGVPGLNRIQQAPVTLTAPAKMPSRDELTE